MTKIAVVGSRNYPFLDNVNATVKGLVKGTTIVTGGAYGVDTRAIQAARIKNLDVEVIHPNDPSKKSDYIKRNFEIVDLSDYVFIFWDGKSKGTKSVVDYCLRIGKHFTLMHNPHDIGAGVVK